MSGLLTCLLRSRVNIMSRVKQRVFWKPGDEIIEDAQAVLTEVGLVDGEYATGDAFEIGFREPRMSGLNKLNADANKMKAADEIGVINDLLYANVLVRAGGQEPRPLFESKTEVMDISVLTYNPLVNSYLTTLGIDVDAARAAAGGSPNPK